MTWTVATICARKVALDLCRGCYQRNLVMGIEALSGSTLRGKAASYSSRYRTSRANLLARIRGAGVPVREILGKHRKRILVLGHVDILKE